MSRYWCFAPARNRSVFPVTAVTNLFNPLLCISSNVSRSDIVTRGKYSVLHPNGSEWLKVGLINSSRVSLVTLSAPPHSFKMCLRRAINNMRRDRISRVLSLYVIGGQRVLTEISGCFASSRPKRRIGVWWSYGVQGRPWQCRELKLDLSDCSL